MRTAERKAAELASNRLPQNRTSPLEPHVLAALACPVCAERLQPAAGEGGCRLHCRQCGRCYESRNGIIDLISPHRRDEISAFQRQYDALRLREGWASTIPGFYAALPHRDLTGRHAALWRIRARSLALLQVLVRRTAGAAALTIVEVGAGSGWMSRHLAGRHRVLALDINDGPHGLNAFSEAERRFTAVRGEMLPLPLQNSSVDFIFAGASVHYAPNFAMLCREMRRCLRPGGRLFICDSPCYADTAELQAAAGRTRAYYAALGCPELAAYYHGLLLEDFLENVSFEFQCLRADVSLRARAGKWLRHTCGRPAGASFPVWLGVPRP